MKSKMKSLWSSFRYAFRGLWHCIMTQRNFRIHLTAAFYALSLGVFLKVDGARLALLLLTIATVLFAEMLNTAMEALVDLMSAQQHPLAKIAKDVAAGAVLVLAAASVVVGIWLLWRPDQLRLLAIRIFTSPGSFTLFAVCLALTGFFVFGVGKKY
jgi:diacylglycerol kinase